MAMNVELELTSFSYPALVCPNCSNALTISRAESTNQYPMGVNRFECRTCPYEDIIGDKSYYEKTEMKQKEVEDVFGGANEFANADNVASKLRSHTFGATTSKLWRGRITDSSFFFSCSTMPGGELQWGPCILLPTADS